MSSNPQRLVSPSSRFWNWAAGINAAPSDSIAMGSTAAHLHNEEEVEHELAPQASHLDLLCLLAGVQNASKKGAALNNLALRPAGDDPRLLCRPCSRSLETRVRQWAFPHCSSTTVRKSASGHPTERNWSVLCDAFGGGNPAICVITVLARARPENHAVQPQRLSLLRCSYVPFGS